MKTIKIFGVLLALVVCTLAVNAQTKSYNKYGVSMTYPSYLVIEEEDYSNGELTLSLASEDEMSGMYLIVSDDEEISEMIQLMGLETVFKLMQSEVLTGLGYFAQVGEVKATATRATMPFTINDDGLLLQGEMTMDMSDKFVVTIVLGIGEKNFDDLKKACSTLKVE